MYLALRWPWTHVVTQPSSGPPVVMVGTDAGVPRPKKKRRLRPAGASQPSSHAGAGEGDGQSEDPSEPAPPPPLTAADRALEWRGDDVALPPRTVDMAGGDARPLDNGEIQQVIGSQAGGVKDCVVQGATGTDLTTTITVKLLVDGHGRVTKSRIQAPHYLLEHGLYGCTQRAAGRMHFPATGEATIVTLPVNLG